MFLKIEIYATQQIKVLFHKLKANPATKLDASIFRLKNKTQKSN